MEYSRCYYTRSDDDGVTFSDPVDITATFDAFRPEYDWKVLATGPGHGIRLTSGRLLVPVWLSTGTGGHAHRPSVNSTIYSDDNGMFTQYISGSNWFGYQIWDYIGLEKDSGRDQLLAGQKRQIFWCPSEKNKMLVNVDSSVSFCNYGMNDYLNGRDPVRVTRSSETMMFADTAYNDPTRQHWGIRLFAYGGGGAPMYERFKARHSGGRAINMVYVAGHVKPFKVESDDPADLRKAIPDDKYDPFWGAVPE